MNKNHKLLARPVEADTRVLMEDLVDFGDFTGLMELWKWDGITGSSIILLYEDVGTMEKDKLLEFVFSKMKIPVDPQTTYKVTMDYVYINFGFVT